MPQYDPAKRRRGVRKGREKGAWIYLPAEELAVSGFSADDPPPFYRLYPRKRTVLVQLYRES